jgi:glycosyltransferase involved in cell wall biosynthesis
VVICAQNEAENLQKNLPSILNQQYPQFEIIVVDDGSSDDTRYILDKMQKLDQRIKIVSVTKEEKKGSGKKYALQKGIESAKYNIVLLTDADCQPVSESWISEMSSFINEEKKIVLGVSPYKTEYTILNGLQEYETAQTALQYMGFALSGKPYMGVGRNVCYDKKLITSMVWTEKELSVPSGDDDLVIQSLSDKDNTTVCISPESKTISKAKDTWKAWFRQKLRHYGSGAFYKASDKILLGSYLTTKVMLHFFFLLLIVTHNAYSLFFIFLLYALFITIVNLYLNKKIRLNSRWFLSIIYDPLYCFLTVLLGVISKFKKSYQWK